MSCYGAYWKKQLIHSSAVLALFALLYTIVFLPRIWAGSSNISGDVFAYYLPVFHAPRSLWTPLLHSGFPSFADPQFQLWYPLNRLFALFPNTWEAFTISAYVLASSFTYGYVYCLTKSRLAAATSGAIYGMSGFMMAYWGYSTILHAAAWIPLLIWALEKLRDRLTRVWLLAGTMAFTCILLAGHPQIAVYGLALSTVYALVAGYTAPIGRWRYYRAYGLMACLALGLAAIQLLPTLEFVGLSMRSQMSFADFTGQALSIAQLIQLVFPRHLPPESNILGMLGYVGLLTPVLAMLGYATVQPRRIAYFWLIVAFLGVLLALGNETPLAQLTYYLPIYNKFRAPVRNLLITSLAMSVLVGFGITALQQNRVSTRLLRRGILMNLTIVIMSIGFVVNGGLPDDHWQSLLFPIGLWFMGVFVLIARQQATVTKKSLLMGFILLIMIVDLFSFIWLDRRYPGCFNWFAQRAIATQNRPYLTPSTTVVRYQKQLMETHQRVLAVRGVNVNYQASFDQILPNTSLFWGIPNASGYGPLVLSRYHQLLSLDELGGVPVAWLDDVNRSLDILAVRYILSSAKPSSRWQFTEAISPRSTVYENQQVLPRTWLVPETIALTSAQVLSTIQTSKLPDGRIYEPRQMALVEDSKALLKPVALQLTDAAKILKLEDTQIQIQIQTVAPRFLVLSDVFYPGWQATIDGKPTKIYQTNYVQRGVQVPAGDHVVEFKFESLSFKLGAGITIAALFGGIYGLSRVNRSHRTSAV
jgi:uncharacterized membrane protein YfhO